MTLYRLKKEGQVEREGQNWSAVAPPLAKDLSELLGPVAQQPVPQPVTPSDIDWEDAFR